MHKDIKRAVAEAERMGFEVRWLSPGGHTVAWIVCPCGDHVKVFSTGKNPTGGAKTIMRFLAKHAKHIEDR